MFIPATIEELRDLKWDKLDIILVTGDSYIDSSYTGVAVIGKWLIKHNYKVAIISQPTLESNTDICKFGEPKLFWGVTSGAVDSMVANYTALKKRRKNDDLTAGGINNKRPDRAVIRYCNLIKQFCSKDTPIVIGGIEASLRRITHYDYWSNKLRKPILFDSKADILVYGEGERSILEIAERLKNNQDINNIRGTCYISKEISEFEHLKNYIKLPSYDEVVQNSESFRTMFDIIYKNNDPANASGLIQQVGDRFLVQNPPSYYLENDELDQVYEINYENKAHPIYKKQHIKALETIKNSITSHRGCFGECNFCAITVHFGRKIRNRTQESIINEAKKISNSTKFNGIIYNIGGASANMYNMSCKKQNIAGSCKNKRCLTPEICSSMTVNHAKQIELLKKISKIPKIKRVFVSSGIRYDLVMFDKKHGIEYAEYVISNCVSGQLKIAPEHTSKNILEFMAKNEYGLAEFNKLFKNISKKYKKRQYLTYYLIAAHPGCELRHMQQMNKYFSDVLQAKVEQIQIFTPTPSTYSTMMYYTEKDFRNDSKIFVEKNPKKLQEQKDSILALTKN